MGVSLATVASLGLASATRPRPTRPDVPVSQYVAASGHRAILADEQGSVVVETSHLVGNQAWSDASSANWSAALFLEFEQLSSWHWMTETEIRQGQTNRTLYHLGDQGLRAFSFNSGSLGFALTPALVELPADPSPGTTWEQEVTLQEASTGTMLSIKRSASIEASPLGEGCIAISYDDTIDAETTHSEVIRCPGRGIVATSGATLTDDPLTWAGKEFSTLVSRVELSALTPLQTSFTNDGLEYHPTINSAAVALGDGFAYTNQLNQHLSYLVPNIVDGKDAGMKLAWVRRPGPTTLALLGAGDLVIAATSDRQLVAYDTDGLVRWQVTTSDIVGAPPVQLDPDTLVMVTLDGFLTARDLRTGEQKWRTPAPTGDMLLGWVQVEGRPMTLFSSGADLHVYDGPELYLSVTMLETITSVAQTPSGLVVADTGGLVTLIDLQGRAHWSTWTHGCTYVINIGDVVFCPQTDDLLALSAPTGDALFTRPLKAQQLFTDGSLLAVLTEDGMTMLNTAGATQYELPLEKRTGISTYPIWGRQNFFLITNMGEFSRWGRP